MKETGGSFEYDGKTYTVLESTVTFVVENGKITKSYITEGTELGKAPKADAAESGAYRDGDKIWFGTSHKDAVIYMDVYSDGKNVESKVFRLSDKILEKNFAYIPEYKDGASINFRMVRNDKFFNQSYSVTKPIPDNHLKLKWSVFRNTLIPGQAEQWTMNIVGPDGKPADAELLALMYDASLDKIRSHYLSTIYRYYPRRVT